MKVLKSKIAMLLVIAMVLSNGGTLVLAESIDDVVSETQNTELNSQSKASVYYEELEITEANENVVEVNDDETTVGADIIRPTVGSNDNIKGLVTIAGKMSDEIDRGTLNSIYKQSGIKKV